MHTSEVISTLHQRGITLKVVNDGLKVRGAEKLTDREKATLKRHKTAILKALAARPNPTITAAGAPVAPATAVVEPPARECRNCSHFEAYPYEPLGSCHAFKRMQHLSSKPRKFGCSDFKPIAGQQEVRP